MKEIIEELDRNKECIVNLLGGLTEHQINWKPDENSWCLLEVICHLYDEEQLDFRARFSHILESPEQAMSPINPPAWIIEHDYMGQNFEEKLQGWKKEREHSLDWLKSLVDPDLTKTYLHPKLGPMSAKFMLSNWLAHDYLHLRQILKLKYAYLERMKGTPLFYAGDW